MVGAFCLLPAAQLLGNSSGSFVTSAAIRPASGFVRDRLHGDVKAKPPLG